MSPSSASAPRNSRIALVCVPSAHSSVPARMPARRPMMSIWRCTTRLFSCTSSGGTSRCARATSITASSSSSAGNARLAHPRCDGLDAVDRVAGEHHLHRLAHAEEPRVEVHVGHAEAHRGIAHLRVLGDVDEVAAGGELAAAGEAVAVHLGDHRLGQVPDAHPALGDVAGPVAVAARRVDGQVVALVAAAEVVARGEATGRRRARSARARRGRRRRRAARRARRRAARGSARCASRAGSS